MREYHYKIKLSRYPCLGHRLIFLKFKIPVGFDILLIVFFAVFVVFVALVFVVLFVFHDYISP
jgi:hypothetical protein